MRSVREEEVAKQTVEVVFVVVGDVPEHALEVACSRGLVDGIDNLLEAIGDDFIQGALLERQINHLVGTFVIVVAVFLADRIKAITKKHF